MSTFLVYIIKSAVCLAVFYLFYKLLMSRETFHRFNRFALLGLLALAAVLPLARISLEQPAADTVYPTVVLEEVLASAAVAALETDEAPGLLEQGIAAALLVYVAGILFFAIRNVWVFRKIRGITRRGKKEKLTDYLPECTTKAVLSVTEEELAPFSWMNHIVISRRDLQENGTEILRHELAHVRNRHSIDLLIADCCILLQWFNPAAWLLKAELQNTHEFEADETVIREGVDIRQYQMLLIKKAVGSRLYSIANSFNHSKLKKRITMMLKKRSNPWARAKYFYVLPVAAVAVAAFARPEISAVSDEISSVKVSDFPAIQETNRPEISVVPSENTVRVEGTVVDNASGKPIIGASVIIRNTTTGTLSDENGKFTLEAPKGSVIVISFIGLQSCSLVVSPAEGTSVMKAKIKMLEETTQTDEIVVVGYEKPEPESASQVKWYKAEEVVKNEKNGPESAQQPQTGVKNNTEEPIFIVVEEMPEYPGGMSEFMKFIAQNIKYPADALQGKVEGRVIARFVVCKDGSISDIEIMRSVSPSLDAEAVRVLKLMPKWKPGRQRGRAVPVKFTVPVTFRLEKPKTDAASPSVSALPKDVAVFVDGKRIGEKEFAAINPKQIELIKVIKDKSKLGEYGVTDKNGVILIKMKPVQNEALTLKVDKGTDAETVDSVKNFLRGSIQKITITR